MMLEQRKPRVEAIGEIVSGAENERISTVKTRQELVYHTLVAADQALARRDFSMALAEYDQVFSMGLESWSMHVNAGQCHKRLGDLGSAFKHFDRAFEIKRRPSAWAGKLPPSVTLGGDEPVDTVFVSNLREQLRHLADLGRIDWFDSEVAQELRSVERLLSEFYGRSGAGRIDINSPWTKALLKLSPSRPSLEATSALLSQDMRIEQVALQGGEGDRLYIIDNLFSPVTLEALLEQLLCSTIWFDPRPRRSYLGAHLHDGLATPFMLEVTKALKDVVQELVGEVRVAQLWAFRYLANSEGIDIHADEGDWNLNVWPVSETYLIDRGDRGGMTIYDLRIANDTSFHQYNSQPALNWARIEQAHARSHVVEYRGNRAVVFPSKYLHKTNSASFADTFAGRRINVTMMVDKIV